MGTRSWLLLVAVATCLVNACATASADVPDSTTTVDLSLPIALVVTERGLAGVPVGTTTSRWVVAGAVAAPDGSAVFAVDAARLVRIDPRTGRADPIGALPARSGDLHVAAVEPGGARVVLVATSEVDTEVIEVDTDDGTVARSSTFEGRLEPEALSLDRSLIYAARIYPDHYHVHVLDPTTGDQWPTLGPDKSAPPEDMYGSVVQAALSPNRAQLATLYRDGTTPDHTAFVHLLDLESGSTVCIDLHAPIGTGAPGTDAIEWQSDGTVDVGHSGPDRQLMLASFDPAAIWAGDPQPHYHADARPDPDPPTIPDGVAEVPGFKRFVSLAP